MLDQLRQHWKDFRDSPPGQRFQCIHKRRAKKKGRGATWRRWFFIALGTLMSLAGLFFLAAPGPGTLVLAIGLALIAGESLTMARLLDWLEVQLRPAYLWSRRRWRKAGPAARGIIIVCASAAGLATMALGYFFFVK